MKFTVAIALLGAVMGKHHHHHHNLVALDDPFGNQNESFAAGKKEALDVVAKQVATEAKLTTNIANANEADIQQCEDEKNAVRIERHNQMNGGLHHQSRSIPSTASFVYVPEEEVYIQMY